MNLPNRLTLFRLILSPFFLVLFYITKEFPASWILVAVLWLLFILGEVSDVLDGWVARKFNMGSDFGKIFDPFADVISRLTVFLCLMLVGLAPVYAFVLIMYREISMTFLRLLFNMSGKVQAASSGGKLKAVLYFSSTLVGLALYSAKNLGFSANPDLALAFSISWWVVQILFAAATLVSVLSFSQYFHGYLQLRKKTEGDNSKIL